MSADLKNGWYEVLMELAIEDMGLLVVFMRQ